MAPVIGRLVVLVLAAAWAAPQLGVALAASVAPVAVAGGPNLLAPLAEGQGRVFSEKPDGIVKATAAGNRSPAKERGQPFGLKDGEAVTFVDDNGGLDGGEKTVAQVVARKKKSNVPNGQ